MIDFSLLNWIHIRAQALIWAQWMYVGLLSNLNEKALMFREREFINNLMCKQFNLSIWSMSWWTWECLLREFEGTREGRRNAQLIQFGIFPIHFLPQSCQRWMFVFRITSEKNIPGSADFPGELSSFPLKIEPRTILSYNFHIWEISPIFFQTRRIYVFREMMKKW